MVRGYNQGEEFRVHKPKTIQEAVKDLKIFFLVDLYTKFNPEETVDNEVWIRDDPFRNFNDFQEYIEEHFKTLQDQIKELETFKDVKE